MGERASLIEGKYELVARIGEGSQTLVSRGIMHGAAGFTRPVALKTPREELRLDRAYLAGFVAAARVASQLRQPNLVEVLDLAKDEAGLYHLVMEWVEGMTLPAFVRSFSRQGADTPWPLVAAAGVGALRGLAAAHERVDASGVAAPTLHRALAPHQILLSVTGTAKLADLGLAALRPSRGRLAYAAPELASDGTVNVRAEIYAMGAILWEALAGVALEPGESDLEGLDVPEGELRSLEAHRSDLPPRLCAMVTRAMAREPRARFASASAMANELSHVLGEVPWTRGPQQDLGAAVQGARIALHRALITAGELELTQSGIEFVPEGAEENPILLTPQKR